MNPTSESTEPSTKNRGVNVQSHSLSPTQQEVPPLNNVKQYIKQTIDSMGPTTPQISATLNDTDVENDDTVYTSTSVYASYTKIRQPPQSSTLPMDDFSIGQESQETQRDVSWGSYKSQCEQHRCYCQHRCTTNRIEFEQKPLHCNQILQRNEIPNTKRKSLASKLKGFYKKANKKHEPLELYKVNITQTRKDESPPRRFVFDLIDNVPKPDTHSVATNTCRNNKCFSNQFGGGGGIHEHKICRDQMQYVNNIPEMNFQNKKRLYDHYPQSRVDVYYFDHGNAAYYRTTDTSPLLMTELLAEKTEIYTTRFWAQLFGTVHIGFAFFTSFILQLIRFLLQSLIRPLTVGVIQMCSDYCCKPSLAVIFNGVIQPPMIFFYNIGTSIRDVCEPIAECFGFYVRELAILCQSIRLIDVKKNKTVKHCDCETIKTDAHDDDNKNSNCDKKNDRKPNDII